MKLVGSGSKKLKTETAEEEFVVSKAVKHVRMAALLIDAANDMYNQIQKLLTFKYGAKTYGAGNAEEGEKLVKRFRKLIKKVSDYLQMILMEEQKVIKIASQLENSIESGADKKSRILKKTELELVNYVKGIRGKTAVIKDGILDLFSFKDEVILNVSENKGLFYEKLQSVQSGVNELHSNLEHLLKYEKKINKFAKQT